MDKLFANTEQPYVLISMSDIKPTVTDPVNESLKKDILENGMLNPLILREGTNECMFGNQRIAILKSLNIEKEIPVRYHTKEKK